MCTITLNRYKSGTIHTLSRCVDYLLNSTLMCSNTLNKDNFTRKWNGIRHLISLTLLTRLYHLTLLTQAYNEMDILI